LACPVDPVHGLSKSSGSTADRPATAPPAASRTLVGQFCATVDHRDDVFEVVAQVHVAPAAIVASLELGRQKVWRVEVPQAHVLVGRGADRRREAWPVPAVREPAHMRVHRHQIELQALTEPAERRRVVGHRLHEATLSQQR